MRVTPKAIGSKLSPWRRFCWKPLKKKKKEKENRTTPVVLQTAVISVASIAVHKMSSLRRLREMMLTIPFKAPHVGC
jgi:hypothetical protein